MVYRMIAAKAILGMLAALAIGFYFGCVFWEWHSRKINEKQGKQKSNADVIRKKLEKDEDLADCLLDPDKMIDGVPFCGNDEKCNAIMNDGGLISDEMCKRCLLKWLKAEVRNN